MLSGELSLARLERVLTSEYGFGQEGARAVVGALAERLDELYRVAIYRLLKELKEE